MIEFMMTLLVFMAVVAAMAIGVLSGRKPISGSCGGLNNMGVDGACEICGGDTSKCEEQSRPAAWYNAADTVAAKDKA